MTSFASYSDQQKVERELDCQDVSWGRLNKTFARARKGSRKKCQKAPRRDQSRSKRWQSVRVQERRLKAQYLEEELREDELSLLELAEELAEELAWDEEQRQEKDRKRLMPETIDAWWASDFERALSGLRRENILAGLTSAIVEHRYSLVLCSELHAQGRASTNDSLLLNLMSLPPAIQRQIISMSTVDPRGPLAAGIYTMQRSDELHVMIFYPGMKVARYYNFEFAYLKSHSEPREVVANDSESREDGASHGVSTEESSLRRRQLDWEDLFNLAAFDLEDLLDLVALDPTCGLRIVVSNSTDQTIELVLRNGDFFWEGWTWNWPYFKNAGAVKRSHHQARRISDWVIEIDLNEFSRDFSLAITF